MSEPLVISIDAMGGDRGPAVVAPAVAQVIGEGRAVRFLLHGDETALKAAIAKLPALEGRVEIRHSERVISGDEKPGHAMRRGKGTSMWAAIDSVRAGEAAACVSAGNTGALWAIARLQLRMLGDLERPALVASWPTAKGHTAVLDVGANIECDAQRLVEYAILGAAFHHAVHGSARPTVGVLNVGSEEEKGHDEVRGANRLLREMSLDFDYRGFVEGDDIAKGTVDVIVTDAFTGNVALKTGEGLARYFINTLRSTFASDPLARIGAFIAQAALRRMAARFDPSSINAAPFLGLNGIVVKTHGGADARGFATAIKLAADLAATDFVAQIDRNLKTLTAQLPKPAVVAGERSKA
ncbi:MAG TPA: phosphate acyltransferase PlsX [Caulobacteraceae bacterium]|nr:phosphate acyltransferase PlsX [Caulobacteraceae bacterium]